MLSPLGRTPATGSGAAKFSFVACRKTITEDRRLKRFGTAILNFSAYDVHHIVPTACGGAENGANGVFLAPVPDHQTGGLPKN